MSWPKSSTARSASALLALGLLLSACAPTKPPAPPPAAPAPLPPPAPAPSVSPPAEPAPPTAAKPRQPRRVQLPAPPPVRSHAQLREQVAQRLMAAHPDETYDSKAPQVLLAVPVLLVELRADGAVRRITVLRWPNEKRTHDTVQLAIDAIHRAAPYGHLQGVPQPWTFTESFLFDNQRRFKPRSLD